MAWVTFNKSNNSVCKQTFPLQQDNLDYATVSLPNTEDLKKATNVKKEMTI